MYDLSFCRDSDRRPAAIQVRGRHGQSRLLSRNQHSRTADLSLRKSREIFLLDLRENFLVRAGITGLSDGQKFFSVPFIIIPRAQIRPQIQRPQSAHILRVDLPGLLSALFVPFDVIVDIFSVERGDARCVMRTLHSTLYFERIDSRVDEIGEDLEDTEVSHGDRILLLPLPQADLFSVRVKDRIGEPAGARAPAAVAAPAAEKARHQAPSRVGIAHGAVNKAFDLHGFLSLYGPDFFKGQLPGRYDSADAQFLEKADRFGSRAGHLCRGVQFQAGTSVVKRANNAQILDDHSIQTFPVEGYGKIHRLLQFTLLGEHIEG